LRANTVVVMMALIALLAGMTAAGVKYVAVVETEVDAQSGASANLNPAEVREITAEIRRQAIENLPPDRYSVMTSETVQSMGGAVLEECADENCVITLGSKIGADYIVRGIIGKFQTRFTLKVEMYETDNGMLIATSEPIRTENVGELLDMATVACGKMFRKFAGTKTQTAVATQSTGAYTANTRDNRPYDNSYDDFTEGQRWATWGLNVLPIGLGSFLVMKDNVGGGVQLGVGAYMAACAYLGTTHNDPVSPYSGRFTFLSGIAVCAGGQIFNAVRSFTYRKPGPKFSAANLKPYDGLKLALLPTESGDCKVFARYDYSF